MNLIVALQPIIALFYLSFIFPREQNWNQGSMKLWSDIKVLKRLTRYRMRTRGLELEIATNDVFNDTT